METGKVGEKIWESEKKGKSIFSKMIVCSIAALQMQNARQIRGEKF